MKESLDKSFARLNATQFFGAMNDNVFRGLLVFCLIEHFGQESASKISAFAGMVFVVPFLLFTPYAGRLADAFSKRNIIVAAKWAELAIMLLGIGAFLLGWPGGLYAVLFLMCAQSAFFGPSKYGIVPELVGPCELSRANSFLEGLTYLAIVSGTAAAPGLAGISGQRYALAAIGCVVLSVIGLAAAFGIEPTPASGQKRRGSVLFVPDVAQTLRQVRGDRELLMAILAGAYFMLLAGFAQMNLMPYGIQRCGLTQIQSGYLFVIAAVGIGAGCFLAGKLSGRGIEPAIVPIGALLMSAGAMGLWLSSQRAWIYAVIVILGFGAGLFIVPINAFVQLRSPRGMVGQVVAASSFLGWAAVAAAALVLWVFGGVLNVSAGAMFAWMGVLSLALAVSAAAYLREFLLRFVLTGPIRLIYRLRVYGLENLPIEGGALLVCNHISWADGLVLGAAQTRRIRFLVDRKFYEDRRFGWFLRNALAIPISADDSPKQLVASLREARRSIERGYIVGIFAEGELTRTGHLGAFRGGLEKIVRTTNCPVIPAYLGGLWGSVLSYRYGRILSRFPRRLPEPVRVIFGEAMPADSTAEEIRQAVVGLSGRWFDLKTRRPLAIEFIKCARKNWSRLCIADTVGRELTYGQTAAGACAIAGRLGHTVEGQQNVGIMLAPSVGGVVANIAAGLLGKSAVNLNYAASQSDRETAIEQCGIKTIITSKVFLSRAGLSEDDRKYVFLEDVFKTVGRWDKIAGWLKGRLLPVRLFGAMRNFDRNDTAAILYSSGSSAQPKGVMLSCHNILSNIEAVKMVYRFERDERLCAALPFFHSFGLTCTLWLPILTGAAAFYVSSPLDARAVGKTAKEKMCTLVFSTPTFLQNYIRRCERGDFSSLKNIVVGAEKLRPESGREFTEKFGVEVLEGYGATELSPMASLNVPDVEIDGVGQAGKREGSVGRALPGTTVKVIDVESGLPVGAGQAGLLWVKGPNVMKGYLGQPEKTAEAIVNGWYNTGDIATVDEEGFITITDRLSRFSKIGGEMVAHSAIERVCMEGPGGSDGTVAVTSLPDEKKGEQLVVLYVGTQDDGDRLYRMVAGSGLPNLCKPRRENFIAVEQIPTLGSGKLDLVRMKKIAAQRNGGQKN